MAKLKLEMEELQKQEAEWKVKEEELRKKEKVEWISDYFMLMSNLLQAMQLVFCRTVNENLSAVWKLTIWRLFWLAWAMSSRNF